MIKKSGKVLILGAGVIGVTTAYFLRENGFEVTVLDSGIDPAGGASFANGAQLSYSKTYPLSNLKTLSRMPGYLFGRNSPIHLRKFDLEFMRWGMRFVTESFRAEKNSAKVLELGLRSREIMHSITQRHELDFDYTRTGKLFVFDNEADFLHAAKEAEAHTKIGVEQRALTSAQAVELEPALYHMKPFIKGVIYSSIDECGDARKFTVEMARVAAEAGVKFVYGAKAGEFKLDGKTIKAIDDVEADAFVVCLGIGTNALVKQLGLHLPIYPMKGYSISMPATAKAPKISITDEARKIVYSTIGGVLRVAGVAEFNGYNLDIDEGIISSVVSAAKAGMPEAADYSAPLTWCGLRPMTASTVPVIEKNAKYDNLYFNTGHGMLGWTLAAASAERLTKLLDG